MECHRRRCLDFVEATAAKFGIPGVAVGVWADGQEIYASLLDVMTLPSVSLSIIPMRVGRHGYRPRESFDITDSDLVSIEMLTGFLSLTHSDEIAAYVTAWEQLYSIADLRGPEGGFDGPPDVPEVAFAGRHVPPGC